MAVGNHQHGRCQSLYLALQRWMAGHLPAVQAAFAGQQSIDRNAPSPGHDNVIAQLGQIGISQDQVQFFRRLLHEFDGVGQRRGPAADSPYAIVWRLLVQFVQAQLEIPQQLPVVRFMLLDQNLGRKRAIEG